MLGIVGDVLFDGQTGAVSSMKVDANPSANALLGRRNLDSELIRGFRTGIGAPLLSTDMAEYNDDAAVVRGGILVSDEAKDVLTEGLADRAGRKAGEVSVKARAKAEQAKPKVEAFAATAKDKASQGAQVAGKAINKGARFAGERLAETRSMLAAFKEEYDKAVSDEPASGSEEASSAQQPQEARSQVAQPSESTPSSAENASAPVRKMRKVKKVRVERT
jgi:hypothetical protein